MNYENISLNTGMYRHANKSFSQVLAELDPQSNYAGTALDGLDAYARQLKRFNIKLRGAGASTVDAFFANSESAVLFPEFISRALQSGIDHESILPSVAAVVTDTANADYRPLSIPDTAMSDTDEGAEIARSTIMLQKKAVALKKFGRVIETSYEALRGQKLEPFAAVLRTIGASLAREHLAAAVDTILFGDGNSNGCTAYTIGDATIGGTTGVIDYPALINFWNTFDAYTLNTMLVSRDAAVSLLTLPEFQNANAGFDFQSTGKLITPLGATLIPTSAVPNGTIIGLDRNAALEMVTAPAVSVETDKLIERQLERIVITSTAAFAKLCGGASASLSIGV